MVRSTQPMITSTQAPVCMRSRYVCGRASRPQLRARCAARSKIKLSTPADLLSPGTDSKHSNTHSRYFLMAARIFAARCHSLAIRIP